MTNLTQRVWSAIVLGTLFVGVTLTGGVPFVAFVAIMATVFWAEWTDMKMPGRDDRLQLLGIVCLIAMAAAIVLLSGALLAGVLVALVLLFATAAAGWGDLRATGGFLYAAGLLVSLAILRGGWGDMAGLVAILFLCAVVWATDIGAYFVGRAVGGPKLAPRISPNKTISGAFGGLASAIVAALLIHLLFGLSSTGAALWLAIALSIVSQAGDLFESWIKRRAGVKDSGRVIPGHGGVMDRVDGLVFAAIALWFACIVHVGLTDPARAFFH